jgi:Kae1-associated kinase Bud32
VKLENDLHAAQELNSEILKFCRHVAGQSRIAAIALVDDYSTKPANERVVYEVMMVIHNFQPRLMSYLKTVENKTILVFVVDQWIFERDIDRGFLGEAIAAKLIFPHKILLGEAYLWQCEIELKKRLVLELMENLVFSFPELVFNMQILPQYFMYEVISSRIRIFPLLAYDASGLNDCLVGNEEQALACYKEALKKLEAEGKIKQTGVYWVITEKFSTSSQSPKIRLLNIAKNGPRTLFSSLFGVLPQFMSILSQNTEEFLRTQKLNWERQLQPGCAFVDPQKYVFFPTEEGLLSLADKIDIKGFVTKMSLMGQSSSITVKPVGGVLNDVYLINAQGSGNTNKVLAKRFKDWSGFKWFPLTLWSFGARSFAVSGQARLAKECATSALLRSAGFNVPKILHVSNAERLIFMEYIEGENLAQAVKRIASADPDVTNDSELALIEQVGTIMANVHSHNVTLGDTKPDNVLIRTDGKIFLIDFEQATRGGDKAWDVAVFLYYCGHYLQPFFSNTKAEAIAKAFIAGYLKENGNIEDIQNAGSSKYQRVFSIFTMPPIMLSISNICKNAKQPKKK